MPRRSDDGLSYVPVDSRIFDDPKIKRLIVSFGADGPTVYLHLLMMVFRMNYYLEISIEDLAYDLHFEIRFKEPDKTVDYVLRILNEMVRLELIDSKLAKINVITSKGMQKQYMASTTRRKEKDRPYWILTEEDEDLVHKYYGACKSEKTKSDNVPNVDNNSLIVDNKPLNVTENKNNATIVHKVKEKEKGKVNHDKKDKYDKGNYPGFLHYCTQCLIEDHFITIYESTIPRFNELFNEIYSSYGFDFDLFHRCFTYCRDYVNRNKEIIDDKFNYFKVAFTNSMAQMEGYDERMQHWRETVDEILRGLR